MRHIAVVIAAGLMVTGCAGTYVAPSALPTKDNERVVARGFDETWTRLVDKASQTFFAIDNFEKESGLMTLSFGADQPSRFIDCGQVKSPQANFEGPYADYVTGYLGGTLTGRMNLLLQKVDATHTKVRISARYVLNLPPQQNARGSTWTFDSGMRDVQRVDSALLGTEPTRTCQPTGAAEREILNALDQM